MLTPFGKILMFLDGREVAYTARAVDLTGNEYAARAFPNVRDVYLLTYRHTPNGQPHTLTCRPENPEGGDPECGERLEMTTYDTSFGRLSLGVEYDFERPGDDYRAEAGARELRVDILPTAPAMDIIIGAAWQWGAQDMDSVETWLAGDPILWRLIGEI